MNPVATLNAFIASLLDAVAVMAAKLLPVAGAGVTYGVWMLGRRVAVCSFRWAVMRPALTSGQQAGRLRYQAARTGALWALGVR